MAKAARLGAPERDDFGRAAGGPQRQSRVASGIGRWHDDQDRTVAASDQQCLRAEWQHRRRQGQAIGAPVTFEFMGRNNFDRRLLACGQLKHVGQRFVQCRLDVALGCSGLISTAAVDEPRHQIDRAPRAFDAKLLDVLVRDRQPGAEVDRPRAGVVDRLHDADVCQRTEQLHLEGRSHRVQVADRRCCSSQLQSRRSSPLVRLRVARRRSPGPQTPAPRTARPQAGPQWQRHREASSRPSSRSPRIARGSGTRQTIRAKYEAATKRRRTECENRVNAGRRSSMPNAGDARLARMARGTRAVVPAFGADARRSARCPAR